MNDYAFLIKMNKMRAGDIVALFSGNFRLGVAVDSHNLVVIYKSKQVEYQTINILLHNINDLSSLTPTEVLPKDEYEIYKSNILMTPQKLQKTTREFFKFLIYNLKKMHTFTEGDILKMEGPLILKYTLYHHYVIFSGIYLHLYQNTYLGLKASYICFSLKKLYIITSINVLLFIDSTKYKIIHKSGELNFSQILKNIITSSAANIEVKEENLLDVAIYREAFVENIFDKKFSVNSRDTILRLAKARIGEKGYDLITDNCQHFCNSLRYGVAIAQDIEDTTFEGVFFY